MHIRGSYLGSICFASLRAVIQSWMSHLISKAKIGLEDFKNSSYAKSYFPNIIAICPYNMFFSVTEENELRAMTIDRFFEDL